MSSSLFSGKDFAKIPRTIIALGFVSLFMDISSEMIHSLLPVFLVSVLGSTAMFVGLIEGVAEATAMMTRVFSGMLSDRSRKRKPLILSGYMIGTVTKPFFALASSPMMVFGARFFDRFGKGVRGSPRDALIADISPVEVRGASYGLRQSLDTAGALVGPVLAFLMMLMTAGNIRFVFWFAVIPGILAVLIILFRVEESGNRSEIRYSSQPRLRDITQLTAPFWMVCAAGFLFTLSRFSEAFLLLRAQSVGIQSSYIPLFLVIMNGAYALTAYPVGKWSDQIGRTGLLRFGLLILIVSNLVLAFSSSGWQVAAGVVLWGLHMGFSQGLFSSLVADTATRSLRGTAFGFYNLITGCALLVANMLAGYLWDYKGPAMTFLAGTLFAAMSLLLFDLLSRRFISQQ